MSGFMIAHAVCLWPDYSWKGAMLCYVATCKNVGCQCDCIIKDSADTCLLFEYTMSMLVEAVGILEMRPQRN